MARHATSQGRAVRDMQRGPYHLEGENICVYIYNIYIYIYIYISVILHFSARAGLSVFPYDILLRSELRGLNISEKI